ncbi:NUDIX hydrolase [Pseudonocardia sp. HH130630-07]|uniref:NUDIX hydrolase n=1 Tax=Pseudonocardia sp. HH130630-07 TaxID=1690815 RepID=UPI000815394E|nr:NUDIX hydrolase [Pseudonocardia sp. HH130630-07]ANY05164.1 NUDIX hydrolase [Pseudonocardia sp. HH130630-07]
MQRVHPVAVVGVVVSPDGRVLAARRRDDGRWEPPGGILEAGERFEDGVAREIHEETGLDVRVERLTGVYKNLLRDVVVLVYRCSPVGGTPGPREETSAVEWITPEEAVRRMPPVLAARVTDALAGGPPASRAHDGHALL